MVNPNYGPGYSAVQRVSAESKATGQLTINQYCQKNKNACANGYPIVTGQVGKALSIDGEATAKNGHVTFAGKIKVTPPSGYKIWVNGDHSGANKADVVIMGLPNGASSYSNFADSESKINGNNGGAIVNSDGTVTINIYDGGHGINDAITYVPYLFLIEKDAVTYKDMSKQVVMPLSGPIKFVPAVVDASISLTSSAYSGGDGKVLPKDKFNKVNPGLQILIGNPFKTWSGGMDDKFNGFNFGSGLYMYRVCSLKITFSGDKSKYNLLNTDYSNDDCNTTPNLVSPNTISNGLIKVPGYHITPSNGTFEATLTYMYYIANVPLYHQVFTRKATLGFTCDPTTGICKSETSAVDSAENSSNTQVNGQEPEQGADNTYNQCYRAFKQGSGWTTLQLVGKPLCSLITIIVSAATHLATYAIQYVFKPAIGLV